MREGLIRTIRSSCVAVAVIPFFLAGCGGGAKRVSGPEASHDPTELVAWVNVAPAAFHAGQTAEIEVGVRNLTTHPIVVAFIPACISYVVKDADGIPVAPNSHCIGLALPFEMAPGQIISAQLTWSGTSDGMPAPPGEYRVESYGLPRSATPVAIQILAR